MPDFLISFLETPNFLACVSSIGRHKWKLITNERSAMESSFHGVRGKIFKWFERFSDWTVCNSLQAENMWRKYCPQYDERLSTIYNLISIPNNFQGQTKHSRCEGKRCIVVAASYQYLKGPVSLVKAVFLLNKELQCKLKIDWYGRREVVPGDTRAYDEAHNLIRKYNLSEIISFHDETKDIYSKMANADAIGLFSQIEGFPNTVCEGLILGKPIIMTRVSDWENLVGKENGYLCDPDDVHSICNALQCFLNTPDNVLSEMGESSLEKAKSLLDQNKIIEKWNKLFIKLNTIK